MIKVVKDIMELSGEYKKYIKKGIIVSFINGIFASVPLLSVYYFFCAFEKNDFKSLDMSTVWNSILIFLVGIIGGIITKYLSYHYEGYCGCYMAAKERISIGDHLRRVPMSFFKENSLGDIAVSITSDLQHIETNAPTLLDLIINGLVSSIISTIFLMIFNIKIGIIFLIVFIIALLLIRVIENKGDFEIANQKKAQSIATNSTIEYIRGITIYKMYRMMGQNTAKLKKEYDEYSDACEKSEYKLIPLGGLLYAILKAARAVVILAASLMALNGELSLSIAAMMIVASFSIFTPIESISTASGMIRQMETVIDRVKAIKNFERIDADGKDIKLHKFDIEINNASFAYENQDNSDEKNITINNVSFKVKENSMTAIVGPSGCGKTTMTRLIARFYDVLKGEIKVGGVNVKKLTCDSLLENVSMVFQNVYLFNDTIMNNIKFGNSNATEEEVKEAVRKARCDVFIENLPDGYNTVVGEGGAALSGGEKQRISIARAILKDAPIVLLDEATANIDPENEVYIQEAISQLVENKTLIVIAHRLNTIKDADQIVVMNEGQISDIGTHEELLKRGGIYEVFWNIRQNANVWQVKNS
ncbi:ABC transporter ATP-binding protein [Clostridium saccharobutylicum]|uniref:Lipid A export ATP-binding/permease protein MsbA n=1 Tax=Clostridium saccharobutylicum TaxID=169679 RepID=A0A1S8ND95_CLOSA|nr:ABC transporter ATP-binding protein [Clostridium saccharobutylicum]OOM14400.1 lipid A export ATP-binding/permease protein MsbA [Clostridium saccharobutylicum]